MNTWFLEFFFYGILARCWIYSYANAKYCLVLRTRYLFDIYLQINSTGAIGTKLNLLQAQSPEIQTVLVTSKLLLTFVFPLILYYIPLFSKSFPFFSNLFFKNQILT